MSHILEETLPKDLPPDSLTVFLGDYFYRATDGKLYQLRATSLSHVPLEIILLEYPSKSFTMKSE
jgi:hypothetical protein